MRSMYRRASENIRHHADGGQGHRVAGRSSSTSEAAHRALKYSEEQYEQGFKPIHQKFHSHFRHGRLGRRANLSSGAGRRTFTWSTWRGRGIGDPSCKTRRRRRFSLTSSRVLLARNMKLVVNRRTFKSA